jgi:AsmA-like protein
MTPRIRRFLWISASLAALLIGAALAVPLFVDINRYHDLIESQAGRMLGRQVVLGRMSLRLLPIPGVSVKPVRISSDRPGDPPFFQAESLAAHARILPLLRGRIDVASLTASRPELNLHRYPDGRFNLPAPPPAAAAPSPAPAAPQAAGSSFSLSRLRIRNARLRFVDEKVIPGKTVTTILEEVDVALSGYAPARPFGIELRAELPPKSSGVLALAGILALPPDRPGAAGGATDLSIKMTDFQPSAFAPYFQSLLGIRPPGGSLSAALQAKARLRTGPGGRWEMDGDGFLRGTVELRHVALSPAAGGGSRRGGDLDLALDMALVDGGRRIAFKKLEASTGKSRLAAGGHLFLSDAGSQLDVTVRPSRVMAEDIETVAAVLGVRFPAGLSSQAPITFSGGATGPLSHPERMAFRGEIELSGVRYADPSLGRPIEDAGGRLTFADGALQVDRFAARVGETKVAGKLSVRDFQSPQLSLALTSPRANLDDLLALLSPAKTSASTPTSRAPGGDILDRTRGTGTIRIDEGSFGTFRFSRFAGDLRLEGKVVTFDPVAFQLYGGKYQGLLSADLRGAVPRYAYRSSLAGVDSQRFLSENLGVGDLLAGALTADLSLQGAGSDLDRILQSMQGEGTLRLDRGWIGRINVLGGLAKVSNLLGETTLAKVSGEVSKNRTDFSVLTAGISVSGGRLRTNDLKVTSRDLEVEGKGSFSLAGNLDFDLKVLFSPELTGAMLKEGSRARYLEREGDRIALPLTIRGPVQSPTYGVDLQAITRSAAKSEALEKLSRSKSPLGELAGALLGRKAGPAVEAPPPERGPGAPPPEAEPSVASADEAIRITSRKYEGSFLLPDLTLRGEFAGVGLTAADLKVEGKGDRLVLEKTDAFKEIAAYYTAHDRSQPARIPFKLKIDGKRLAGAGDLKITITLRRSDGSSSVQSFTEAKRGF